MSARYLMGLDVGGGTGRCLLVDIDTGKMVSSARPWTHPPAAGGGGWGYDFEPEQCWEMLAEATRETLQKAKVDPGDVLGVAVTSMRFGLIVLDGEGQPIFAAPNLDSRAVSESTELGTTQGEMFHQRTGHWPIPIFMVARLNWLARHKPEILQKAATVLSISDWFAYRLCGKIACELSQAGESLFFDLKTNGWAWDLVDQFGLSHDLFSQIIPAGSTLGILSASAAQALGLKPGIPVAAAGGDTQCGLLGSGAIKPGEIAAITGTTAPIQAVIDQPLIDPTMHLWTGLHVLPGRWVLESNAGDMGKALEWFAGMMYPDAPRPVARMLAEAGMAQPGESGIFSTFGVQVMNAAQMGLPVGNLTLSHFSGLSNHARRRNILRAILEGMAYGLKANIAQITPYTGGTQPQEPLKELKMGGGLTRSPIWCQTVSDVLDLPVVVSQTPESSALGAAICAGVGAGIFLDLAEGAERLARSGHIYNPDGATARLYHELYSQWTSLREAQTRADDIAADILVQQMISQPEASQGIQPTRFKPRILVTAQLDEVSLAELRKLGEVKYANYRTEMRLLTGDELVEELRGYHIFITEVDMVDLEALQQLPDLRLVVSCRGNAVNVDSAACTAVGIPVLNAPGRNADAVADLALAFMLMLGRKLIEANIFLREPGGEAGDMGRMGHAYDSFLGNELWGKTVGLVGLGAVGRGVAQRLQPFRVRILVYDPFIKPEDAELVNAELVSLERLLEESDIVSLHAAVTDSTRGLIGAKEFAVMKPGACLVNTARAALVDEEALVEHLRSGRLGGAALDVFSVEPPAYNHPLLVFPNVIATPHVGGNTVEVAAHQGQIILEDIRRMLAGTSPLHALNPEILPGFRWEGARKSADAADLEKLTSRPTLAVSDVHQAVPTQTPKTDQPTAKPERQEGTSQVLASAVQNSLLPQPPDVQQSGGSQKDIRTQMEKILSKFVERAKTDPVLITFSAKRKVVSHYTLNDLGLEFYIGFKDGEVVTGLGTPPQPAEVRMKANTQVLDDILTGRISGNKAAMSGKLSFSGDVRLAMGMQRIQADMIRLYSAARAEAGGLGDLASLAKKNLPPSIAAAPKALDTPQDPREELVQSVNELFQIQLVTATGGNLSIRIPGKDEAWITPSQLYKGNLRPEAMVRIDLEGNALDPDALAPSSEQQLHTEIYKVRPDVMAIIHAHAPYATILGMSGKPFLPITTDAAFFKELPRVPFLMPGSKDLALAVVKALGKNPALIMQNHGIVVAASSLRRASNLVEAVERTSQLILGCYSVGKKPPILPKEVIKMLQEVGEMMA